MAEELKLKFSVDKEGVIQIDQLAKNFKKVDAEVVGIGGSLKGMKASWDKALDVVGFGLITGAAMMAYQAVRGLTMGMVDAAKEGEGLNKTTVALDRALVQAGVDVKEFRAQLKPATGNESTIAELEGITFKLKEMGFEWQQIPKFMAAAKSAADVRNEDVKETSEKLGKALAAGSEKALKPYGLLLDKVGILADAAREAGIPVAALTEEQERSAFIAAGMAQLTGLAADSVDGLGSAAERTGARMQDAFDSIKRTFAGGIPSLFTDATVDALKGDNLYAQLEGARKAVEELDAMRKAAAQSMELSAVGGGYAPGETARVIEEQNELNSVQAELFRALADNVKTVGSAAAESASKMERMNLRQEAGKASTDKWLVSLDDQATELYASALAMEQFAAAVGQGDGPLTKAATAARTAADRLADQTAALREMRDAYKDPTMLAALEAQLRAEELAGRGMDDLAISLRNSAGAAKDAAKPITDLAAKISGVLALSQQAKDAKELLPSANPDRLAMVAAAMGQVAKAKSILDKAMEEGDRGQQAAALANLQSVTTSYAGVLAQVGLETPVVAQATKDMTDSMALLSAQVRDGTDSWDGWLGAVTTAANKAQAALAILVPYDAVWSAIQEARAKEKPKGGGGAGKKEDTELADTLAEFKRFDEERVAVAKEGNDVVAAYDKANAERRIKARDDAKAAKEAELEGLLRVREAYQAYQLELGNITQDEVELMDLQAKAADATATRWEREAAGIRAAALEHKMYGDQVATLSTQVSGAFDAAKPAAEAAADAVGGFGRQTGQAMGFAGKSANSFTKALKDQSGKQGELWAEGIGYSSQAAAAFIGDEKTKYRVLGFGEVAFAAKSYASGDVAGGIGHTAAAGLFFAAAEMSGGGTGGGGKKGSTGSVSSLGTSAPVQSQSGPANIYLTIQGAVYGGPAALGQAIAEPLNAYARAGGTISSRIIGR